MDKKKVGVITYCYPKGLGILGLTLYDLLSKFTDVEIFPINDFNSANMHFTSYKPVPVHPDWNRVTLGKERLQKWIDAQDAIIVPEVVTPKLINYCRIAGKKFIHIPMQEWVSTNPIDMPYYKKMDHIVCPVSATYDLFKEKLHIDKNLSLVKWALALPYVAPKEPTEYPTFFLNAGTGGVMGRRYTDMQIKVFRELIKIKGWEGTKLILKAQFKIDLDFSDNVEYITGDVPYADILDYYKQADLSLCASKWEGIGYHILESLYSGVPVLTTKAAPMHEWVDHNINGILVPCTYPNVDVPIKQAHPNIGLNWVKASLVNPGDMLDALVLLGKDGIFGLKSGVHQGLAERESAFISGWKEILGCQ